MKQVFGEPMSRHTTLGIGGPAERFAIVSCEAEMSELISASRRDGLPWFVLGQGSNLLVSDEGYQGLVVKTAGGFCGVTLMDGDSGQKNLVFAEAGASLWKLASFARDNGLSGLEFASGIPGTVGGALMMNAGAYGGEMKDVVASVRIMDQDGNVVVKEGDGLKFGYRTSVFRTEGDIVLGAVFELNLGDREEISRKMADLARVRREKQPLEFPSAGSTWKRPEGHFAAKLIEDAGCKGLAVGGAMISDKHAGFLVNTGGATALDVRTLMKEVERRVFQYSGVMLEPEVVMLGFMEGE